MRRSPDKEEWLRHSKEVLERWYEEGSPHLMMISLHPRSSPHPRDLEPVIDRAGYLVNLDAAWRPPIGSRRWVVVEKTRAGRFYFRPAKLEEVPEGTDERELAKLPDKEYDRARELEVHAMPQVDEDGNLYFRTRAGRFIKPLQPRRWIQAGVMDFIGQQTIKLLCWPRRTILLAMPADGFAALRLSTITDRPRYDKLAEKEMIKLDRQAGFIRIKTVEGESIPVSAFSLLGSGPEDELVLKEIKRAERRALGKAAEAEFVEAAGRKFSAGDFTVAVRDAAELLREFLGQGVTRFVDLHFRPEVEEEPEPEFAVEPAATGGGEEIACPQCRRKNRLPIEADRALAICGNSDCKAELFPELAAEREEFKAKQTAEARRQEVASAPVETVKDVGPKAKQKLAGLGISTVEDLATAPDSALIPAFGPTMARKLQQAAQEMLQ